PAGRHPAQLQFPVRLHHRVRVHRQRPGHVLDPRQLVAFSRDYPQVRLNVVPSNRWVDLNEEGFDLALRVQKSADSPLVMRQLGTFHVWLVASPDHLKSRGRPNHPRDLTRHLCVNMQSYRFAMPLIGPRGRETVEVSGRVISNDMQLARQLVEQGAGVRAFIFPPGDHPSLGKSLTRVLPDYVVEGPRLFIATTSRKSQPLRVRLLREFLINAYAQHSNASKAE
ncbi:MAG: hypothetical protein RL385_4470, partial [Pseudomonadota bacterium]